VLQCVAVCCSNQRMQPVCCSVLQCVAVCCSVLQCVAQIRQCSLCVAVCCSVLLKSDNAACVLQCVAVCCSVLQCVAQIRQCSPQFCPPCIAYNWITVLAALDNGESDLRSTLCNLCIYQHIRM